MSIINFGGISVEYHFNVDVATQYGVNEAIFCHNLYFWIKKNKANNKHFYEGRFWTYNSNKAFTELFPFWTPDQLRTIIKNCEKKDLIIKGNFNKLSYDQTLWYALTENIFKIYEPQILVKVVCQTCETVDTVDVGDFPNGDGDFTKWNCENCQMELGNLPNGVGESPKPIPYNKPYNKQTDKKPVNKDLEKDVNKNQEIIDKLVLQYMKKGLPKELCFRVVEENKNKKVDNLGGYLRGCLENTFYKYKSKNGTVSSTYSTLLDSIIDKL